MGKYSEALVKQQLPKEVYDVVFAEAGGASDNAEILATASTVLNRIDKDGLKKGLMGFSSFVTDSKQYRLAKLGTLNDFEKKFYDKVTVAVNHAVANREPWWYMENLERYPKPSWVKSGEAKSPGTKLGRQTFFEQNNG